jgi:hypothetical protein
MTTFYSLRFETPTTWKAWSPYLYPPATVWPGYTSRHWVPSSSPPTTRRTTVKVFDPASTWLLSVRTCATFTSLGRTEQKSRPPVVPLVSCAYVFVDVEPCLVTPLPRNGCPSFVESVTSGMCLQGVIQQWSYESH